jgi:VWFA-related protein
VIISCTRTDAHQDKPKSPQKIRPGQQVRVFSGESSQQGETELVEKPRKGSLASDLNMQRARQLGVRVLVMLRRACILYSFLPLVVVGGQLGGPTSITTNDTGLSTSPPVHRTDTTIRVHSDLVVIPVTVTDRSGRAVSGLEREHFAIFEDHALQEITHFAAEDSPISIGIVFDTSDSMAPKLRRAREAVNVLLNTANLNDEFFLVKFSTEARIVVPRTSQFEQIRSGVATLEVNGSTALLDAIRLGIAEMKNARYSRKAIIIISDGEDNSSHWTVSELHTAVREQEIVIYAIGITDSVANSASTSSQLTGAALLKEISSQTGGRLFEVKKLDQLSSIADKIGGWLRNQYVLGYVPTHSEKNGVYRKVLLKVSRPEGYPRLHAVWRQGYYAPKE